MRKNRNYSGPIPTQMYEESDDSDGLETRNQCDDDSYSISSCGSDEDMKQQSSHNNFKDIESYYKAQAIPDQAEVKLQIVVSGDIDHMKSHAEVSIQTRENDSNAYMEMQNKLEELLGAGIFENGLN